MINLKKFYIAIIIALTVLIIFLIYLCFNEKIKSDKELNILLEQVESIYEMEGEITNLKIQMENKITN